MKGRLAALGIVAGLAILAVAFFRFNFYDIHVRYRLTVEVQEDDQVRTGSSVIEALYNIQPAWASFEPNNHTRVIGYAPTVDLGERGLLFLTFANALRTPEAIVERNSYVFFAGNDMYCLPFEAYGERGTAVAANYYDLKGRSKHCCVKVGHVTCRSPLCQSSPDFDATMIRACWCMYRHTISPRRLDLASHSSESSCN
jgi:hypothetical protein